MGLRLKQCLVADHSGEPLQKHVSNPAKVVRCIAWWFRRRADDQLKSQGVSAEHRRPLVAYGHLGAL